MARITWRAPTVFALILAVPLIAARTGARHSEDIRANLPECPHDWTTLHVALTDSTKDPLPVGIASTYTFATGFVAPGVTTNVPEFHDCQRIILEDGVTYGPLMAVFASRGLGQLPFQKTAVPAAAE